MKHHVSKNNLENSSTKKGSKHVPSGFVVSTISSFRRIESKNDAYRGKVCIKNFCESFREHAMDITNVLKKI